VKVTHYVYTLRSEKTGRLYVGATRDVTRRLKEHNAGRSRSTKSGRPWVLAYAESYPDLSAARKREWELKCTPWGGKEKQSLAEESRSAAGG
jgi:putative endonuclease